MATTDSVDAIGESSPSSGDVGSSVDVTDARNAFGNLSISEEKYRYKMDHLERGKFIIINNKKFLPHTHMNERSGTDEDASNLYCDFKKLNFTVEMHHNKTKDEMLKIMIDASREDHTHRDCFGVAVLTHGDDGVLYGIDDIIPIDCFVQPIKRCGSLAGKPKIFIFQACRGNELDPGVEVADVSDALGESARPQRIPLEADCLYAYSTVPGYFSWRNSSKGSWFVQALHKMLTEYRSQLDFLSILTRVNHEVSYAFESNASQAHMTRKKQVPSVVSMLTKDLYFTTK